MILQNIILQSSFARNYHSQVWLDKTRPHSSAAIINSSRNSSSFVVTTITVSHSKQLALCATRNHETRHGWPPLVYTFIRTKEKPLFPPEKSASETLVDRTLSVNDPIPLRKPTDNINNRPGGAIPERKRERERAGSVGCYHATLPENKGRGARFARDERERETRARGTGSLRVQYIPLEGTRILQNPSQWSDKRAEEGKPAAALCSTLDFRGRAECNDAARTSTSHPLALLFNHRTSPNHSLSPRVRLIALMSPVSFPPHFLPISFVLRSSDVGIYPSPPPPRQREINRNHRTDPVRARKWRQFPGGYLRPREFPRGLYLIVDNNYIFLWKFFRTRGKQIR